MKQNFQENDTPRIEAFSDGVFAIDITLLTFELKAPETRDDVLYTSRTLFVALLREWPSALAFLLGFTTIFIVWVNHHRMFNVIRRSDSRFIYYNGLLLLLVSLIPFTVSLLSEYIDTSATELAAGASMLVFAAISLTLYLMWTHATRDYHLLKRPVADIRIQTVRTGLLISCVLYMVSVVLSMLLPMLSIFLGLGMVIFLGRLKYHRQKTV